MEQFRSSPLINHKDVVQNSFKETMNKFYLNAIKRNELIELPVELYWSLAYGLLYSLVRFHFGKKTLVGNKFILTEQKMKLAFKMVIRALRKSPGS